MIFGPPARPFSSMIKHILAPALSEAPVVSLGAVTPRIPVFLFQLFAGSR